MRGSARNCLELVLLLRCRCCACSLGHFHGSSPRLVLLGRKALRLTCSAVRRLTPLANHKNTQSNPSAGSYPNLAGSQGAAAAGNEPIACQCRVLLFIFGLLRDRIGGGDWRVGDLCRPWLQQPLSQMSSQICPRAPVRIRRPPPSLSFPSSFTKASISIRSTSARRVQLRRPALSV